MFSLGIQRRRIRGRTLMLANFRAFGRIQEVLFFKIGRKFSRFMCFIRAKKLTKNRKMLKKVIISDTLVIVFIPLVTLYITRMVSRIPIII